MVLCLFGISLALVAGCARTPVVEEEVSLEKKEKAAVEKLEISEGTQVSEETVTAAEREKREREEKIMKEASEFSTKDIYFAFDRYDLRPEARDVLGELADWLTDNGDYELTIEGHCDERGTTEYNLALGERRAESAKAYLVNLGIKSSRISTISYGEELPLDPGHTEEAWTKNRRDHFVVFPKN